MDLNHLKLRDSAPISPWNTALTAEIGDAIHHIEGSLTARKDSNPQVNLFVDAKAKKPAGGVFNRRTVYRNVVDTENKIFRHLSIASSQHPESSTCLKHTYF